MSEAILQFRDVNKSFFGVPVLSHINIEIGQGRILGLIGENGAGKSTLMNILGGVVRADTGKMLLEGKEYSPHTPAEATAAGIAFIHQELNLFTNLSIAENFFISNFPRLPHTPLLNKRKIRALSQDSLSLVDLKISPNTLVEKLSPGERQLVEVAKALNQEANIIIFDEPTTSLTMRETERLFEIIARLHSSGKTIIYISHILRDVLQIAQDVAVLRDGDLVSVGSKTEYTISKMISQMVGRDISQLYPDRISYSSAEVILDVKGIYRDGIVENISFSLRKGEILGVFGLMGSGRTELAHILFGLDSFDQGKIIVEGNPLIHLSPQKSIREKVAYITENRREEGLMMNATVSDNLGLVALPDYVRPPIQVVKRSALAAAVKNMVSLLKIKVVNPFKYEAKGLSGGNQQKVVLGKWLLTQPMILLVDEPTRGVDVGAKFEIYQILNNIAADGTAVLFISSEIEELIGMCDRIMVMGFGETLGIFNKSQFDREEILRTAFRENGK